MIKHALIVVTLLLYLQTGHAQQKIPAGNLRPVIRTIIYQLGDTRIRIETARYGNTVTPTFINLHDDESTSVFSAKKLLEKKGGLLIRIENGGRRNIRFRVEGKTYQFDPNRIFSRQGIIQTLSVHSRATRPAITALEKFARRLLALIPNNPTYIVALHNNTDGKFSLHSYYPGQPKENDARKVFTAGGQDGDDIFLTTDSTLYHQLVSENYNIVWQDNERAKKDGSLSIYFGERNIAYLNCETEHGRTSQYTAMIEAAGKYLYPSQHDEVEQEEEAAKGPQVSFRSKLPTGRKFEID